MARTPALVFCALSLSCSNASTGPKPESSASASGGSGGTNLTGDSGGGGGGDGSQASGGQDQGSGGDALSQGSGGEAVASGGQTAESDRSAEGWSLLWSDEFEGGAIDSANWEHEEDCWGGGNGEDQCYVKDAKNSFVEAGLLHIVALKDAPQGPEGGGSGSDAIVSKGHSSARLRTINKADFTYGRIEARLRLPFGQGLWPAFWMLPTDQVYGTWAASGEIDIVEAVNLDPDTEVHGTLHYGGMWPDNTSSGASVIPSSPAWEHFHIYAVEWEEGEVRWFVDEKHYLTQNSWHSTAADYPAPFNQRFHIVLNLAVGGAWPGPPDASTTFPQSMLVDYVRVYFCEKDPDRGQGCGSRDPSIKPL